MTGTTTAWRDGGVALLLVVAACGEETGVVDPRAAQAAARSEVAAPTAPPAPTGLWSIVRWER
jgi:hypothetical protein